MRQIISLILSLVVLFVCAYGEAQYPNEYSHFYYPEQQNYFRSDLPNPSFSPSNPLENQKSVEPRTVGCRFFFLSQFPIYSIPFVAVFYSHFDNSNVHKILGNTFSNCHYMQLYLLVNNTKCCFLRPIPLQLFAPRRLQP